MLFRRCPEKCLTEIMQNSSSKVTLRQLVVCENNGPLCRQCGAPSAPEDSFALKKCESVYQGTIPNENGRSSFTSISSVDRISANRVFTSKLQATGQTKFSIYTNLYLSPSEKCFLSAHNLTDFSPL